MDSLHVYCHCDATVQILNVNDGKVTSFLGDNEPQEDVAADRIQTFTLDYKNNLVISAHKSGLLKVWNLQSTYIHFYSLLYNILFEILRLTIMKVIHTFIISKQSCQALEECTQRTSNEIGFKYRFDNLGDRRIRFFH